VELTHAGLIIKSTQQKLVRSHRPAHVSVGRGTITRCSDTEVDMRRGVSTVAREQKAKSKMEQAKGKIKETLGRALGNESMTAGGRAKKSKGDARQAKEKAKDIFRR
jgi:uncharacterized protein YjbJ (UPF0337 family)